MEATGNERVLWVGNFNSILDLALNSSRSKTQLDSKSRQLKNWVESWELTDIWHVLHPTDRRYTCFTWGYGSLRWIDHLLGSPIFVTHVLSADIGTSYASDHSPSFLNFTFDENEHGQGFWRMPEYIIKDAEFKQHVISHTHTLELCNMEANPALLWDTIKSGIRSIRLLYF